MWADEMGEGWGGVRDKSKRGLGPWEPLLLWSVKSTGSQWSTWPLQHAYTSKSACEGQDTFTDPPLKPLTDEHMIQSAHQGKACKARPKEGTVILLNDTKLQNKSPCKCKRHCGIKKKTVKEWICALLFQLLIRGKDSACGFSRLRTQIRPGIYVLWQHLAAHQPTGPDFLAYCKHKTHKLPS